MNFSKLRRMWICTRFALLSRKKKAEYSSKHSIFGLYGDNVTFQPKVIPLYPQLIKIHDNVVVGRNVEFVTHDVMHVMLNHLNIFNGKFTEMCGCIEVMDNVFIGNGSIIMYGVRIAENTVIAAGSVVTRSTESNSVYAGVPARRIGSVTDLAKKRLDFHSSGVLAPIAQNNHITEEEIEEAWKRFEAYAEQKGKTSVSEQ